MSAHLRSDLDLAERAYRAACRRSNLSLGQGTRDEIIDLVNVRDAAQTYIHLLEEMCVKLGRKIDPAEAAKSLI